MYILVIAYSLNEQNVSKCFGVPFLLYVFRLKRFTANECTPVLRLSGKNLEYFLERNYQTLQDKTKEMKIKQKACRQKKLLLLYLLVLI